VPLEVAVSVAGVAGLVHAGITPAMDNVGAVVTTTVLLAVQPFEFCTVTVYVPAAVTVNELGKPYTPGKGFSLYCGLRVLVPTAVMVALVVKHGGVAVTVTDGCNIATEIVVVVVHVALEAVMV
jgi:hypothetical protein